MSVYQRITIRILGYFLALAFLFSGFLPVHAATLPGFEYIKLTNNSNLDVAYYLCDLGNDGDFGAFSKESLVYDLPYTGFENKVIREGEEEIIYFKNLLFSEEKEVSLKILPYRDYQFDYTSFAPPFVNDPRHLGSGLDSYVSTGFGPCTVDDVDTSNPILADLSLTLDPSNPVTQAYQITGTLAYSVDELTRVTAEDVTQTIDSEHTNHLIIRGLDSLAELNGLNKQVVDRRISTHFLCTPGSPEPLSGLSEVDVNPTGLDRYPGLGFSFSLEQTISTLYVDKSGRGCDPESPDNYTILENYPVNPGETTVFTPRFSQRKYSFIDANIDFIFEEESEIINNGIDIIEFADTTNRYCVDGNPVGVNPDEVIQLPLETKQIYLFNEQTQVCENVDNYTVPPYDFDVLYETSREYTDASREEFLDALKFYIGVNGDLEFTLEPTETLVLPQESGYYFQDTHPEYGLCYQNSTGEFVEITSDARYWNEAGSYLLAQHGNDDPEFSFFDRQAQACEDDDLFGIGTFLDPTDPEDSDTYVRIAIGYELYSPAQDDNEARQVKALTIVPDTNLDQTGAVLFEPGEVEPGVVNRVENLCADPNANLELTFAEELREPVLFTSASLAHVPPRGPDTEVLLSCALGSSSSPDSTTKVTFALATSTFDGYEEVKVYTKNSPWTQAAYTTSQSAGQTLLSVDGPLTAVAVLGETGTKQTGFEQTGSESDQEESESNSEPSNSDTAQGDDSTFNNNANLEPAQNNSPNQTAGVARLVRSGGAAFTIVGVVLTLLGLTFFLTRHKKGPKIRLR